MAKKKDCECPAPSELRVFRLGAEMGDHLNYVVPAGKVLIINAWMTGIMNSTLGYKILRNSEVVAERSQYTSSQESVAQVFPTGIAFFAGDTFTLESYSSKPTFAYGYERDA
ncbi:hypothetical protein [Nannocystis bainbridge]|uniref:Uncharacterized protein n=1 Tax=Nannocystis bainbridge TaxID=2995303 RepID=A0ABT5DS39_9BACT|nr:hypothetical protein [Nannocystis bainbridge]MDC0716467.1 hypothetical protein [Nannocystis bainbridge]